MNVRDFRLFEYHGIVTRISDGDTFWVMTDEGMRDFAEAQIRILFADAPELRGLTRVAGEAAKVWLTDRLLGKPVWWFSKKDSKSFDRWLGDVWYAPNEYGELRHLSEDMVAAGMAVPTDDQGRHITTGETA